jgi:hypothetical protein
MLIGFEFRTMAMELPSMNNSDQTPKQRETFKAACVREGRVKLGSLLADIGHQVRLSDEQAAVFDELRDKKPAREIDLE